MTDKLTALSFSILLFFNAVAVRRWTGSWMAPGVLFNLAWCGYTAIPLLVLWDISVNPWSVGYIYGGGAVFALGSVPYFDWSGAMRANQDKPDPEVIFLTSTLWMTFSASVVVAIGAFFQNMLVQGFSLSDMLTETLITAGSYADAGYSGALQPNPIARLGVLSSYVAVCLGGLLFGSESHPLRKGVILVGAFCPAVLEMLLRSQKGYLFVFISMFFGGVLVIRLFRGQVHLADWRTVRNVGVAGFVIVPLTIASFLARGLTGDVDPEIVREVLGHNIRSYAFGHLYAFGDWFSYQMGQEAVLMYPRADQGFGFFTLMSVFRILGSERSVPLGMYDEYFFISDVLETNIYTFYRGLITDFGWSGAYLYLLLVGFFLHAGFYAFLRSRRPWMAIATYILMTGFIYLTYVFSLLGWNSVLVAPVLVYGALAMNEARHGSRHTVVGQVP